MNSHGPGATNPAAGNLPVTPPVNQYQKQHILHGASGVKYQLSEHVGPPLAALTPQGHNISGPPPVTNNNPNSTFKLPTRVEWENDSVGVFVDDDEEALLMTAQDGCMSAEGLQYFRRTEELFSCLQKLVIASMTIGLIGLGIAFIFLIEYIAGW